MLTIFPKPAESRSQRGCWTCRLRKKKCDETRPACSICVGLEIECRGYGDKPRWMDHGPLQRDQALRIKQIVGRTSSKRRKQHMFHPSPDMNMVFKETSGSVDASSSYSLGEGPPNGAGWHREVPGKEDQFHAWNIGLDLFDEDILSASSQGLPFIAESFSKNCSWGNDLTPDNSVSSEYTLMPSTSSGISEDFRAKSTPTRDPSTVQKDSGVHAYGNSREGIHLGVNSASTPEWPVSSHSADDRLLMHYLDVVFYIQYPSYKPSFNQSRSWLFSSLRRARSVYHATLALSELHIRSTVERSLLPSLLNKADHYNMPIQEMELTMEPAGLYHSMDRITYTLQALWYEQFTGSKGNWRSYLLTASTLISPYVQAWMKPTTPGSIDLDDGPRQLQERDMLFQDDTGTRVLLGSFISFDIMACASTRSQPSLGLDHQRILETLGIDLGSLFGCANQVMVLIFETALLDNWKREAEQNRQLSMIELVKRGSKIEERLQQEIGNLERTHSLEELNLEESSGNNLLASQDEITNIFALSTLTYLHVVISGAQPELPEIAESVSKTITAFKYLSEPRLLRNLVWPFCISGCLALEEQQSFFRELFSKANAVSSNIGTCGQAFEIMEECWKMRQTCFDNHCWVSIMEKPNLSILLI
ncbi:C6 transcription factor [Halenospora varia]|nr:C6 transcription factor [Halenospora varia]